MIYSKCHPSDLTTASSLLSKALQDAHIWMDQFICSFSNLQLDVKSIQIQATIISNLGLIAKNHQAPSTHP
jgi:hypothetical protein